MRKIEAIDSVLANIFNFSHFNTKRLFSMLIARIFEDISRILENIVKTGDIASLKFLVFSDLKITIGIIHKKLKQDQQCMISLEKIIVVLTDHKNYNIIDIFI